MKVYDWIVVGAGFTGAALAYELAKVGFSVLLLEKDQTPENATRFSYGGVAYNLAFKLGTIAITETLCQEAIARYQILDQELDADIQFRELDILLTIPNDTDPHVALKSYSHLSTTPQLLSIQEACELEPLLNKNAISAALTIKQGQVHPEKITQAYIQAFLRLGGTIHFTPVLKLSEIVQGDINKGVITNQGTFHSEKVAICTGGLSRSLLKSAGIDVKIYFSHAELIITAPVSLQMKTIVSPVNLQRTQLENQSTQNDQLWDQPSNEIVPPILDVGAIQFLDGSFRLGQITRILTDPFAKINESESEKWLRKSVAHILPALGNLPGTYHRCVVAFTANKLPLIGQVSEFKHIHIFSGFTSPFVLVPPLAKRFAQFLAGQEDEIINQLVIGKNNE